MGERRALVIASQCASLNLLSFLPEVAKDVAEALLDPEVGGCVPALADGRRMLVDPTMTELDDAVAEAFERASEDEATLFIALIGHGDYADDDFYFLTKDTTDPVNSRNSFLLAQRIKELLGRYSLLDGLVILLDTCHAGIAAQQAATRWIRIVGEAGKRFEVLTASDDRTAANGCFSRSLAKILRAGRPELGERVRCSDLKRVLSGLCPTQTAVHLAFDGVRTVEKGDEGLWLALNNSDVWRPLLGHPAAAEIERLTAGYRPRPQLGEVVGHLLTGARCVQITGEYGSGKSALIAALARPATAGQYVPSKFLQAVLFLSAGQTGDQVAGELARQLRQSIPGFGQAQLDYRENTDITAKSALESVVLGPLRTLTAWSAEQDSPPVHIALDNVDALSGEDWVKLIEALRELVRDPGLSWVRLVLASMTPGIVPGAKVVTVNAYGSLTAQIPEPPEGISPTVLKPAAEYDNPYEDWGSYEEGPVDEWSPEDLKPSDIIYDLLFAARERGPLPIRILTAASRRAQGPDRPASVRDVLAQLENELSPMGNEVIRSQPGTMAESVYLTDPLYGRSGPAPLHAILAEAIADVAPASEHGQATPEQDYATASEAEHLWLAGRREDALRSLSDRASAIPVENRERWAKWSAKAAEELGATDPLTLKCRARLATWTGNAGDPASALAQFDELLSTAEGVLKATDPELLAIRDDIVFWSGPVS